MSDKEGLPKTIPYYLADQIQAGIIRWRYPPGSSLREVDLGAEFGCNRGAVREAYRLLELRGLVVYSPRRGFRVKVYTAQDIDHLYHVRAQLEGAVVAALPASDIAALCDVLDTANEAMRRCATSGDIDGYFSWNLKFHQAVIDYSESNIFQAILALVNAMSLPIRYILLSTDFSTKSDYAYHQQISAALRGSDFPAAKRLTEEHIIKNLPRAAEVYLGSLKAVKA
jgi:DNA-binding GntR family transcriptional regulator